MDARSEVQVRSRRAARRRRRSGRWAVGLVVVGLVAATGVVGVPVAAGTAATELTEEVAPVPEPEPDMHLIVNSTAWGSPPGADCLDRAKTCTLFKAIETTNTRTTSVAPSARISVSDDIPVGTRMTGDDPNKTQGVRMNSSDKYSSQDTGAYFVISQSVTIDLGHRLLVDGSASDDGEFVAIYIGASDVNIYNADQVLSSGSSFVVGIDDYGVTVKNVTIDGWYAPVGGSAARKGKVNTDKGYGPERFVVFREGVDKVKVKNYNIRGFYDSSTSGIFVFDAFRGSAIMSNITIEGIEVSGNSSGVCVENDGMGCQARLVNSLGETNKVAIKNLTFSGMTVRNLRAVYAFRFTSISEVENLSIVGGEFAENNVAGAGESDAFILLPESVLLTGATTIARNRFGASSDGSGDVAIYARGKEATGSTKKSGLTIEDNHFDGYGSTHGVVRLYKTGMATFRRNTFGPRSVSQASTASEETASSSVMFSNYDTSANRAIRTWYPSSAQVIDSVPVEGTPVAASPFVKEGVATCLATMTVAKHTGAGNQATEPVTLDLYWTQEKTAEVYLGSVTGLSSPGSGMKVQFSLPVGTVTLPDGTSSGTVVNPATGSVSGHVRVQTQGSIQSAGSQDPPPTESSQYSQVMSVTGNCSSGLTLGPREGQEATSTVRDRVFTLTASRPLKASSVVAADFVVTEHDASPGSSAHVTDVTCSDVGASEDECSVYEIVVRANNTTRIVLTLPPGRVVSATGVPNATAAVTATASGPDASLTYINPLTAPGQLSLVTGGPSREYTFGLRDDAPQPAAEIAVTTSLDEVGSAWLTTALTDASFGLGSTGVAIAVTAAEGHIAAGTPSVISHAVASDDPNYSGLVAPSVTVLLFATDPSIEIVKHAYTNVPWEGGTLTAEEVMASGEPVGVGARLVEDTRLWFVFEVRNVSRDDWASELRNVVVTDTVLGDIGAVDSLGIDQTAYLAHGPYYLRATEPEP
ncbi:hypothetical protein [Xylanimonas ulmi]|uniref:Uncharacterized protein n=1 Tax=Xylanimonas ulmi TaxID=228973 RepID=A0A4Q7M503_9MICO|nr:hypothetical protein [Xylanibacterium ulmi]RZS62027.1 hypothetical protein EV386_2344 [Xylanibacterium ulmi]